MTAAQISLGRGRSRKGVFRKLLQWHVQAEEDGKPRISLSLYQAPAQRRVSSRSAEMRRNVHLVKIYISPTNKGVNFLCNVSRLALPYLSIPNAKIEDGARDMKHLFCHNLFRLYA